MNHFPFIVAAYAVFAVVFLADAIMPWLARRRVLSQLNSRLAREQRRRNEAEVSETP